MGNVTGSTGAGNIVNTNHPVNSIMANSGTGSPASPFHHLHPNALANQVNQQQAHTNASLSSSGIVNIASKNYSKNNHINSKQHTSLVTGMIIPTNPGGHQQTGDQNGKHSHHSSNNNGSGITSQSELISGTSVASVVSDLLKKHPVTTSSSSKSSTAKTAAAAPSPLQATSASLGAAATATVAPSPSSATSTGINSSSSSNAPIALGRNPGYGKTTPATATTLSNSTLSSCKIFRPRNQPLQHSSISPSSASSTSNATNTAPTTATTGKSSVQYHDRSPSHNSIVHRECLINPTCPPSSSSSSTVMTLSNTSSSSVSPNSIDSSISSSSSTVSSSSTGYVSDKNSTKSIDTSSTPVHESPVPSNGSSHIKTLQTSSSSSLSTTSSSSFSSSSYGGDGKKDAPQPPPPNALAPPSSNSHFSNSNGLSLLSSSSDQIPCELVSLRNGKGSSTESKATLNANSFTKGKNIDSGDRVNTSKAPIESSDWQTPRPPPVESLDDVTGSPESLVSSHESPTKKTNLNKGKTSLNSSSSNLSTPVKSSRDSTPKPSKKSISLNEPNVNAASDTKAEYTSDLPNEFKLPGKKSKSTSKSPSIRGDRSNSNPNIERMSPKLLPDRKVWSSQELKHDQSNHNSNSKLTPVTSSNPEISTVTVDRSEKLQSTVESSHIDSSLTDDLLVHDEPDTESNESNCKKEHQSNGDSVATSVAKSSNSLRSSPRHLASLPQVQLLNLTYTALTASSVKLKWTLQQPANSNSSEEVSSDIPNSVLSLIQKNKQSGGLFNHHFIVEMLLTKPNSNSPSNCGQMTGNGGGGNGGGGSSNSNSNSNTGTSVRIVYQGNSNTCRVSHLNPGALYSFKVKTLISDMQHSLVSNLLTITTPEQALNSKHVKHKGTSQSTKQQNQGTSTATSHNSITSNNSTCNTSQFNSNHHGHGVDKTGHGSSVLLSDKISDDSLDLVEFTDRKQALIILLLFTAFALVVAVVVQSLLTHDQT